MHKSLNPNPIKPNTPPGPSRTGAHPPSTPHIISSNTAVNPHKWALESKVSKLWKLNTITAFHCGTLMNIWIHSTTHRSKDKCRATVRVLPSEWTDTHALCKRNHVICKTHTQKARGLQRETDCMCVYLCACNAQPVVFNAVPEGFNPDYQTYKSLSLGLACSLVHTHTHTRTPNTHCFSYGPVSDSPLGGAVDSDREHRPLGVFSHQTLTDAAQTSDQLHSAWPISTHSQPYCCLIPHLFDVSTCESFLCLPLIKQSVQTSVSVLLPCTWLHRRPGFRPPRRQLLHHLHAAVWSA